MAHVGIIASPMSSAKPDNVPQKTASMERRCVVPRATLSHHRTNTVVLVTTPAKVGFLVARANASNNVDHLRYSVARHATISIHRVSTVVSAIMLVRVAINAGRGNANFIVRSVRLCVGQLAQIYRRTNFTVADVTKPVNRMKLAY